MNNKINKISLISLIFITLIFAILSVAFLPIFKVKAEETIDLETKSALYTANDYLINDDLSIGTKTIRQAATEISNMELFDVVGDITHIIPVEYLRCNMEEKYFQY